MSGTDGMSRSGAHVYFFQSEHGGPVKIGSTGEPVHRRLSKVQTGNPERLVIRNVISCEDAQAALLLEAKLHAQLADYRLYREWFLPTAAVAVYAKVDAEEENPDPPTLDRWSQIADLWRRGVDRAQIAEMLGWPVYALKREMTRMRRYGYELPHARRLTAAADVQPADLTRSHDGRRILR